MTKGGRNLIILGVASSLIAIATTGVSLAIYHNSGDIYLDRSRPGYLPDEEEIEEEEQEKEAEEEYKFSDTGTLTVEDLEEYLKNFQAESDVVEKFIKPFDESVLSDGTLGIPAPEEE